MQAIIRILWALVTATLFVVVDMPLAIFTKETI